MAAVHYRWETMADVARRVAEEFPITDRPQRQQRGGPRMNRRGRVKRTKPWRSVGCGDPRQIR